jgi:hypothetical protein
LEKKTCMPLFLWSVVPDVKVMLKKQLILGMK